jgi:hypothetical protein
MEEENVQVVLRLRPVSEKERRRGEENVWKVFEGVSLVLKKEAEDNLPIRKYTQYQAAYNFDRCFSTSTTNEMVYAATIKNMVDSAVNGINATVFMYGQTGSGKTFTMLGYDQKKGVYNRALAEEAKRSASMNRKNSSTDMTFEQQMQKRLISEELIEDTKLENKNGLLIQALKDLFVKIKSDPDKTFFVKCSYVEIYNDLVYDLLQRAENISETLNVCEDAQKEQFYIRGVREEAIDDWTDAMEKLKRGEINRHYARTVMNHSSSRSHTIFRVYIQSLVSSSHGNRASPAFVTESWFNFVDLAGSEKVSNHDQIEEGKKLKMRVKEGKHINKSLFFLTQVIKLKSEGTKAHIPYRNSPLTKILRSSLGGNSRTVIVLCVNPTYEHMEQTLGTIRFGLSAKKIQNKISANVVTRDEDEAVRIMIADYEKRLRDFERDREQQREREKKLLGRIQEVEEKHREWVRQARQREGVLVGGQMRQVSEKMLENCLLEFEKHGNHAHMDEAGLLMTSAKGNKKYQQLNGILRRRALDAIRIENSEFGDFDQECLRRTYLNPSGKHAMAALEKMRRAVGLDLALYEKVKENWGTMDVAKRFGRVTGQVEGVVRLCRENIGKIDQVVALCEEESEASRKLRNEVKRLRRKIDEFEGNLDYGKLSDEELRAIKERTERVGKRCEAEENRRKMIHLLRKSEKVGLSESQLTEISSLLAVNYSRKGAEPEEDELSDDDQETQSYLERIRDQCKADSTTIKVYEEALGPTSDELTKELFSGCDKILASRRGFEEKWSTEWREYQELWKEGQQRVVEEIKNRSTKAEGDKAARRHLESVRESWIDVDELVGKVRVEREDSEMSVSEDVHTPRAKREDKRRREAEDGSESEEGSDEGEGERKLKTPRMGYGNEEEDVDIEVEEDEDLGERRDGSEDEEWMWSQQSSVPATQGKELTKTNYTSQHSTLPLTKAQNMNSDSELSRRPLDFKKTPVPVHQPMSTNLSSQARKQSGEGYPLQPSQLPTHKSTAHMPQLPPPHSRSPMRNASASGCITEREKERRDRSGVSPRSMASGVAVSSRDSGGGVNESHSRPKEALRQSGAGTSGIRREHTKENLSRSQSKRIIAKSGGEQNSEEESSSQTGTARSQWRVLDDKPGYGNQPFLPMKSERTPTHFKSMMSHEMSMAESVAESHSTITNKMLPGGLSELELAEMMRAKASEIRCHQNRRSRASRQRKPTDED